MRLNSCNLDAIINNGMNEHDINIRIKRTLKDIPDIAWFRKTLHNVILSAQLTDAVECGLLITDDKDIRKLNSRYRNINQPTDVLSFKSEDDRETDIAFVQPPDGIRHLGEIIISCQQVQEQAKTDKTSIENVFMVLIVHGFLHLLGYDHENDADACEMESREAEILKALLPAQSGNPEDK